MLCALKQLDILRFPEPDHDLVVVVVPIALVLVEVALRRLAMQRDDVIRSQPCPGGGFALVDVAEDSQ